MDRRKCRIPGLGADARAERVAEVQLTGEGIVAEAAIAAEGSVAPLAREPEELDGDTAQY
ncbi:MAG: hypothetical protein R3C12_22220 [Planctomycetaceae bacterium]